MRVYQDCELQVISLLLLKNLIDVLVEEIIIAMINFRMSGSLMELSRVVAPRNLVVACRSFAQIKAGDLGLLAEQSRASKRAMFQPLTVQAVFEKFRDISTLRGHSSGTTKEEEEKIQVSSNQGFIPINSLQLNY